MLLGHHIFRRVSIIGVGLMGGSLGMAIKHYRLAKEVVGFSQRQSSLVEAIKVGAIDEAATDLAQAVRPADLVILATPVSTISNLFTAISGHIRRGCIITDLGSTKSGIVESAEKKLPIPGLFVGSHPLVGSEKTGVENAKYDLFQDAPCIMTPTAKTNQVAKEKVKILWMKIGAKVHFMSPDEHDEVLSFISHLPHLAAFGLMESVPQKFLEFATPSLRDVTRVASSSPQMWADICMANSKNILKSLDEYVRHLSYLRKAISVKDTATLTHHFTKAKEKRDQIIPKN